MERSAAPRLTPSGTSCIAVIFLSNTWNSQPKTRVRLALSLAGFHDPRLPICVFPDGTRLESPTIRQVAEKLGWIHDPSRSEYDLAIYGAGPAA